MPDQNKKREGERKKDDQSTDHNARDQSGKRIEGTAKVILVDQGDDEGS